MMYGETKKTLIVVYKDEMLMNQLKKLVETRAEDENGVAHKKNDSIDIISWTEKVWLDNKKAGNIKGKILYLDDIKGAESLFPVIDVKFDKYGVKYGWAGNQAVLFANSAVLAEKEEYEVFVQELSKMPIPDYLKSSEPEVPKYVKKKNADPLDVALKVLAPFPFLFTSTNQIAEKWEEIFGDNDIVKRQMLFYGIIHFYNNHLEEFMNL